MFGLATRSASRALSSSSRFCSTCHKQLPRRALPPIPIVPTLNARFASSQALERPDPTDRPNKNHRNESESSTSRAQSSHYNKARKGKPASHKPPKRRLEAASAPLRNAPSITRGPLLQCVAHTTAEKYDLVSLGAILRQLGVEWQEVPEGDRERAFVIGPWKGRGGARRLVEGKDLARIPSQLDPAEEEDTEVVDDFGVGKRGEIWVFNSGNFVTWGLTEEEGRGFLRDVIRRKGANVELRKLTQREYEVEAMDFIVDPNA